jgi:carbon storage regulator
MLVLTRRIGQQIVLPGCGVTIDIVGVTKSQVRIGIEAPSDVPVYRREILDRIHGQREGQPGEKDEPEDQAAAPADEPKTPNAAGTSPADLDRCLAEWITCRTGGRIRRLCVKTVGDRTVISGWAASYYARQLAQAAVNEVFDNWSSMPPHKLEYEIDVADRTFVTRAGGSLLFSSQVGSGQPG